MASANDKFFRIQQQIRQNSIGVQEYVSELSEFYEEIEEKDVKCKKGDPLPVEKLPPIRSTVLQEQSKGKYVKSERDLFVENALKQLENRENLKRDTTPMPSYYKNWDSIDVNKEIEKIETGEIIGFDSTVANNGEKIEKPHFPNQAPQ